jgi:hypothetical protein
MWFLLSVPQVTQLGSRYSFSELIGWKIPLQDLDTEESFSWLPISRGEHVVVEYRYSKISYRFSKALSRYLQYMHKVHRWEFNRMPSQ